MNDAYSDNNKLQFTARKIAIIDEAKDFLATSYTSYHAVENGANMLKNAGFVALDLGDRWQLERGKGYYFTYNDSTLIAFKVGDENNFMIAESHTDSPSLKIKGNDLLTSAEGKRLNVERYGGLIMYSMFDIPLKIAGRIFEKTADGLVSRIVTSDYNVNIPSLAIHHNPEVNKSFAISVQNDLAVLLGNAEEYLSTLGDDVIDKDLYVVPDVAPYESGIYGEFLASPRIDNLTSVFASLRALIDSEPKGIAIACCFDNEEIGSGTRQGANSQLLETSLKKIASGLNLTQDQSLNARQNGFIVSADNAHATHQAHPEKSDPITRVYLNGGIVIKHHTNYSTDGLSSAILKIVLDKANIPYQDYYNNSDVRCGGTIGLVSSALTGMRTVDIGLAQLAMHSAIETVGIHDIPKMVACMQAVYQSKITTNGNEISVE